MKHITEHGAEREEEDEDELGAESLQERAHDILAEEPPGDVSPCPDGSLEQNENNGVQNQTSSSQFPPLTVQQHNSNTPKTCSPQNMVQYRNMFNDRARRGFCYWVMEREKKKKSSSTSIGYSFGAYKTSLGLPKV